MTIAARIGEVVKATESATRIAEFYSGIRYLMLSPRGGADELAEQSEAPFRVVEFLKSPAAAGSMVGWAQPLSAFQNLATAFLASLSGISAFDALWPSMLQAPLRTSIISVNVAITGSAVGEGGIKSASKLSLSASDLDVTKCAAFVAITAELLRTGSPSTMTLLQTELRRAITRATNNLFLPILSGGAPSFPSSGTTALAVRQDLSVLLQSVVSASDSKLFLIVTRKIAEAWAVLPDNTGASAFPEVTVDGGNAGGIPIVICDEATSGEIILVDATQVAAATEGITFDASQQASLQLDDAPNSPPDALAVMTSLWQLDLFGLKSERYIGAKVLRPNAVAKITGAAYSGNSPA